LIPQYAAADPVHAFTRIKSNYHQILSTDAVSLNDPNGANTNQPISCQALLDAAANASFTTQGTGEHLLPPSGSSINTHLTSNYLPKSDVVNNSSFSTNTLFTASDANPPSELAVRAGLDSKPTASLLSYTTGQQIVLGSNNSAVPSDTVLLNYAVPIPSTGSGAGKLVARNANDDGWEFVSSTSSSSSLTIDTSANATSTSTQLAQTVGTGIFYQNGTQLRVQYKISSSNFHDVLIGLFDITSPVITILGNNPETVTLNSTYTDAGATALDNVDGDITNQIQTTSTVDTTTAGSYTVTYALSDSAGNSSTAIRTVQVNSPPPVNYPLLADLASLAAGLASSDSVTVNGTTYSFTKSSTLTGSNFVGIVDRSHAWTPNIETGFGFNTNDSFNDANGNVVSGPYFGMQLSSQITATSVKLYIYYQILSRAAKNFSLYGSNNGSAWYLIGTTGTLASTSSYSNVGQTEWTDVFTGTYNGTQVQYHELSLTNSTAYSYYRVSIHECFSGVFTLNEFRLMGS
jgi:hypothetical protein